MKDAALVKAATTGDLETVTELLYGEGIPTLLCIPDALVEAAWRGHLEIVEALLPYCDDINARPRGYITALDSAIHGLHFKIVRLLILSAADVNAKDSLGQTPLHRAVDMKVEHAKNWDNTIPEDAELIGLLLDAGADVNARTHRGESAFDWAVKSGYRVAVELMRRHGATDSAS
jgi:ankyrin repeat protein